MKTMYTLNPNCEKYGLLEEGRINAHFNTMEEFEALTKYKENLEDVEIVKMVYNPEGSFGAYYGK